MKRIMIAAMIAGSLMMAQPAQATVTEDVKAATVWVWNLVPKALKIANGGIHVTYKVIHGGVHKLATFLEIEDVGE